MPKNKKIDLKLSTTILDLLPVAVDIVDKDRNIQYANKSYKKMVNNNCVNKKCFQILKDSKQICTNCPISKGIENIKGIKTIEVDGVNNGKAYLISHSVFKDAAGELLVLEVFQDVTMLKKIEHNLTEQLKETSLLQQAVEASTDGIIIADSDGNIVYVNPSWSKMTGYTLKEVLGKNPNILQSGKTPKKVYDDMWKALIVGKSFLTKDIINKRKDGTEYAEYLAISPILESGKIIFYVGIGRDITKEKDIDKAKSDFISIVSHQLRTPLTSIRWVVESFLKHEKLTKRGRDYLKDIHISARRLTDLIDVFLNVSRIEEGAITISAKPVELVSFIKEYLKECEPLCGKKHLLLTFDKHPKSFNVTTDVNALRNIIHSILSNAIEYTPNKGKINVSLEKKSNMFLLTVVDTGIGIPKNEQETIFDKFTRGKNATLIKTDGTGLGLYIAKMAVNLLGGKIRFESKENKGTIFYIELPIKSEVKKGAKSFV